MSFRCFQFFPECSRTAVSTGLAVEAGFADDFFYQEIQQPSVKIIYSPTRPNFITNPSLLAARAGWAPLTIFLFLLLHRLPVHPTA